MRVLKNAVVPEKRMRGSVLNKIISLSPEHKSDIKSLAREVAKIVEEVNSLEKDSLQSEYSKYASDFESEQRVRVRRPQSRTWNSRAQSPAILPQDTLPRRTDTCT